MIIFGWRTRNSVEPQGAFECPVCRVQRQLLEVNSRRWFTLFFVPVFPLSGVTSRSVCAACQNMVDVVLSPVAPSMAAEHSAPPQPLYAMAGGPQGHQPIGNQWGGQVAPAYKPPAHTSALAIISLIAGLLSPFFFFACLTSFFTTLIAIVTGHIAIYSINRSQGRLHGKGLAIGGLVLGYCLMTVTIAAFAWFVSLERTGYSEDRYAESQSGNGSAEARLLAAESTVMSHRGEDPGSGNTVVAEQLAKQFAADMKVISEEAFTEGPKHALQLSGGNFLTYCELHDDRCVFVVHVPSYRDYEKEAKRYLADYAWDEAVAVCEGHLEEGDRLAVALRGTLLYGDIMIGDYPSSADESSSWTSSDRDDLLYFFPAANLASPPLPSPPSPSPPLGPEPFADEEMFQDLNSSGEDVVENVENVKDPASSPSQPAPAPERPAINEPSADVPVRPSVVKAEEPKFENKIPVELSATIKAEGWTVRSLAFASGDRYLVGGRLDNTLTVFDVVEQRIASQSERIDALGQIASLATARDGSHVIVGGGRGATALMRVDEQGGLTSVRSLFKFGNEVTSVVASPQHDFVLFGDRKGMITWQPYDERSGQVRTVSGLESAVLGVYLPADGNSAMATDGKTLLQFGLQNGEVAREVPLAKGTCHDADFHPTGSHVVVSTGNELVEYSVDTGQLIRTYEAPRTSELGGGIQWTVLYHPTRPWIISGGRGAATVWSRETGKRLAVLDSETVMYIQTLAVSADGEFLAMIPASAGQSVQVFKFSK